MAIKTGTRFNDFLSAGIFGDGDELRGLGGDDNLWGWDGNDTLDGGTGDDTLRGGDGNDVFVFAPGHGNDEISYNFNDDFLRVAGIGNGEGVIDLTAFGSRAPTFAEIQENSEFSYRYKYIQSGPQTEIDLTEFGGGTITIERLHTDDLTADMFRGLSSGGTPPRGTGPDPAPPSTLPGGALTRDGTEEADTLTGGSGNDQIYGKVATMPCSDGQETISSRAARGRTRCGARAATTRWMVERTMTSCTDRTGPTSSTAGRDATS